MTGQGRFDDRDLPGDLFAQMLDGKIDAEQASALARSRWEADDRRGGSMSDRLREALYGSSPEGRARSAADARDALGRFTTQNEDGTTSKRDPTMNELLRMYAAGVPSQQGTIDLSHLSEPPNGDVS